jgi:hypothetical protein
MPLADLSDFLRELERFLPTFSELFPLSVDSEAGKMYN